jgi:hypothetical protein
VFGEKRFRYRPIPDELSDNRTMLQSIFPVVVFGAVALSVVMSVVFLVSRGSVYDQIGQGGMSRESEAPELVGVSAPTVSSAAGRAEQEREIRQMLSARSARMVKKGEPALDIDAEVTKLLEPQGAGHDAGLIDEVRQLVEAKNERRTRQGLEPLDVAEEVERTLQELDP